MTPVGEVTFRDVLIEETDHGLFVKPLEPGGSVHFTVERCSIKTPKRLTYVFSHGETPDLRSGIAIASAIAIEVPA